MNFRFFIFEVIIPTQMPNVGNFPWSWIHNSQRPHRINETEKILVSFEEISRVVVVLQCDDKEMCQKAVMHLQSCCFS